MKIKLLTGILITNILLASCSVSTKINRSAKEGILKNEDFLSAHTGISVYEPSTGKYWYNYQAEKYFVPASNTKILSCYAAMKYLGDSLIGIRYQIMNDSTVGIQATADPTFLHSDYENHPVYNFLKTFKIIQIDRPSFTRYMGNGWTSDDYLQEYMAQRSAFPIYGNIAKIKWLNEETLFISPPAFESNSSMPEKLPDGFEVQKSWDNNNFTFLPGKEKMTEIPFRPDDETLPNLLQDTLRQKVVFTGANNSYNNVIHSQPTDAYLKPMMHRSDNFFAEQSLLMVSNKILGIVDDQAIIDTLLKTDFKELPQKPRWADGSGLSRYNSFSPKDFVFILEKMKNEFGMERIKNILPTGGTGTISSYYLADSGYIFVKTGTLNNVVAISGFLYTRKKKLLIFSALVNHHQSTATKIRQGIEKFIQNLRDKY